MNKLILILLQPFLNNIDTTAFRQCSKRLNSIISPLYFADIIVDINITKNWKFRFFVNKYKLTINVKNIKTILELMYLNTYKITFIKFDKNFICSHYFLPPIKYIKFDCSFKKKLNKQPLKDLFLKSTIPILFEATKIKKFKTNLCKIEKLDKNIIVIFCKYLDKEINSFRLCSKYISKIIGHFYFANIFISANKIFNNKHAFREYAHKYKISVNVTHVYKLEQLAYFNSFKIASISLSSDFTKQTKSITKKNILSKKLKSVYSRNEQNTMKMNVKEGSEFFIASNSCFPGGMRHHANVCLNDFDQAIEFVKKKNCYEVYIYMWDMYVWYYKIIKNKAVLIKEINLNNYVIGAIDTNNNFVLNENTSIFFKNNAFSKYKQVVYKPIPSIKITNPISQQDIISVGPQEQYIDIYSDMIITTPSKKEYIFILNYGYELEGTDALMLQNVRLNVINNKYLNLLCPKGTALRPEKKFSFNLAVDRSTVL